MEEKAYIVNSIGSMWEHFFLSLESKSLREWKILYLKDHSWKIANPDNPKIQDNYQNVIYAGYENNYNIFLKKRFIVDGRDDLFNPEEMKETQQNGNKDFASANIMYILKRQQGQIVERFRGRRIRDLYDKITGLNYNEKNNK